MNDDLSGPLSRDLPQVMREGQASLPGKEDRYPLVCKPRAIEPWRVFKIMSEFVEGFDIIGRYGLAVSFFGTARATFDERIYAAAEELAGRLAKRGFAVITGGAMGVMQAANKGAYEAGGVSIGLNIRLEDGQQDNKYLTEKFEFDHFFVRKVMLTYASEVYVYFPGGFGTMDEFMEILTLVQTHKLKKIPIVLYGREYWTPLLDLFKERLAEKYKAIDLSDTELYHLVDSVDEAFDYVVAHVEC
ncbi:MAG: TIGR00730 family Rossman fold protein [Minisyncoccia bacterium]